MQPISYDFLGGGDRRPERFWLVAELEALEDRDSVKVFVVWMCAYAGGVLPGPYEQAARSASSSEALMGAEEFIAVAHRPRASWPSSSTRPSSRSRAARSIWPTV